MVKYQQPIQRGLYIQSGKVKFRWPEYKTTRSQDLESIYYDPGQFYWCKNKALIQERELITKSCCPFPMNEKVVQDIDTPADWEIAEEKFVATSGLVTKFT